MPFVARLPTWNQAVTIHRLDNLGVWVADLVTTECQFYFGQRNFQLTWVQEGYTARGHPGTGVLGQYDSQTNQYNIFLLVPKTAVIRGVLETRAATGFTWGARDYFTYINPNIGTRTYWIDQVEPRWPGFPNEHKIVVATQRGFDDV